MTMAHASFTFTYSHDCVPIKSTASSRSSIPSALSPPWTSSYALETHPDSAPLFGCFFTGTNHCVRGQNAVQKQNPVVFQPSHMCPVCGNIWNSIRDLREHFALNHARKIKDFPAMGISKYRYQCKTCNTRFGLKKTLSEHERKFHRRYPKSGRHSAGNSEVRNEPASKFSIDFLVNVNTV